jgi:hypothetical protein
MRCYAHMIKPCTAGLCACTGNSRYVQGRTAAAENLVPEAVEAAVITHCNHHHTQMAVSFHPPFPLSHHSQLRQTCQVA